MNDIKSVTEKVNSNTEKITPSMTHLVLKRIVDLFGAVVGCVCLIPLTIIVYLSNLLSGDRGPIFFVQERIGLNGKLFRLYKYRSMCVNADDELQERLLNDPEMDAEYEKYKKLKDDPRITKTGKFIRKTSLDEFPQFVNILKGEMSLVGPRPYLPREKDDMGEFYESIVSVKPGLTGPWQVGGRNDLTFEERLDIESSYAKAPSLLKDFVFFLKTFLKIIKKDGAL